MTLSSPFYTLNTIHKTTGIFLTGSTLFLSSEGGDKVHCDPEISKGGDKAAGGGAGGSGEGKGLGEMSWKFSASKGLKLMGAEVEGGEGAEEAVAEMAAEVIVEGHMSLILTMMACI